MKYYGQFNPNVDKVLHERYFPNKFNGTSIECGAFDGITENCTKFFEENYNWNTINIEPLPHIFNLLKQNRPLSTNLEVALSNSDIDKTITVYDIKTYGIYNTNASLNHLPNHKKLLENMSNNNYITYNVKCNTYIQIVQQLNITHLDLFVLDVEGHEFEVIDGMIGCDILPDIFVIEHGHRNTDIFIEKLKCLKKSYKLDHVSFVNSFFIKI